MKIITLKKDENIGVGIGVIDKATASEVALTLLLKELPFGSDWAIKSMQDDKYKIVLFPKAIKALQEDFMFTYIK